MQDPLTSKRVRLRPAQARDIEDLFEIFGDAQTMCYWSTSHDRTRDETQKRLDGFLAQPNPQSYLVIEHQSRVIGTIGVYDGGEIGFILNAGFWKQGLMSEALRIYLPWAFETFDFKEITADVDPLNAGSTATLLKAGFEETGRAKNTFCIDGKWSDSVYFALQRPS